VVEKESFKTLLQYLRPSLHEQNIPSRRSISREIWSQADFALAKLHSKLQVRGLSSVNFLPLMHALQSIDSLISFSFDAGETPFSKHPILAVQGHWIDSPPHNPRDWTLCTQTFAFAHIKGRHTGQRLARLLRSRLNKAGVVGSQIGWLVGDNAEVNDVIVRNVAHDIIQEFGDDADPGWQRGGKQRRLR
jgi:hypothetical protein